MLRLLAIALAFTVGQAERQINWQWNGSDWSYNNGVLQMITGGWRSAWGDDVSASDLPVMSWVCDSNTKDNMHVGLISSSNKQSNRWSSEWNMECTSDGFQIWNDYSSANVHRAGTVAKIAVQSNGQVYAYVDDTHFYTFTTSASGKVMAAYATASGNQLRIKQTMLNFSGLETDAPTHGPTTHPTRSPSADPTQTPSPTYMPSPVPTAWKDTTTGPPTVKAKQCLGDYVMKGNDKTLKACTIYSDLASCEAALRTCEETKYAVMLVMSDENGVLKNAMVTVTSFSSLRKEAKGAFPGSRVNAYFQYTLDKEQLVGLGGMELDMTMKVQCNKSFAAAMTTAGGATLVLTVV